MRKCASSHMMLNSDNQQAFVRLQQGLHQVRLYIDCLDLPTSYLISYHKIRLLRNPEFFLLGNHSQKLLHAQNISVTNARSPVQS